MPTAIIKNLSISPVPKFSGSDSCERIASGGIAKPAICSMRDKVYMNATYLRDDDLTRWLGLSSRNLGV